jgi:hypothetical protein
MLTKHVLISSNRNNYAITTYYRFPALLTLPLHRVTAMSLIPFGKWWGGGAHLSLRTGRDAATKKNRGETPH